MKKKPKKNLREEFLMLINKNESNVWTKSLFMKDVKKNVKKNYYLSNSKFKRFEIRLNCAFE